jgi:hypothetical protein
MNVFEKLFILDDLEKFESDGAGQRAAAEGSSMHAGRDFGGQGFRGEDGTKGQTRSERLGDQSGVRFRGE